MADDTNNVLDTEKRFEIFVPNPKARINLGKKNTTTTGPFGYDGVSIQSDVHLFIDANKHTLFQTGGNYCGQVGGSWVQYANKDMVMSSTGSANLTAAKKVVIATSAGQGQVTALDHGSIPSSIRYNALGLHYAVDKVDNSLFEFFYGRRKRDDRSARAKLILAKGDVTDEDDYFDGSSKASAMSDTTDLGKGFLEVSVSSLRELYPVAEERDALKFDEDVKEDGDAVLLFDDLVNFGKIFGSDDPSKLEYGFSSYLSRFDPYLKLKAGDDAGFLAKGLVGFMNGVTVLGRFIDVTEKYANLITDNFLMKRVTAAFDAYTSMLGAVHGIYKLVKLPFGSWNPDEMKFMSGQFQDEYDSGLGARAKGAGDGAGMGEAFDDAKSKTKGKKAKIETPRGPWDLSSLTGAARQMTVEWGDKAAPDSCVVDLGAATPAMMTFKPKDDGLPRLMVTVLVSGLPAGTSFADIEEPLAAALGVEASELAGADAAPGVMIQPEVPILEDILYERTTLDALELKAEVPAVPATTTQAAVAAVPAVLFQQVVGLTVAHHSASVSVAIDGVDQTVSIGTQTLASGNRMSAVVQAALSSTLSGVTVGALDSGAFLVTTSQTGPSASIEVVGATESWVYKALGARRGQEAVGQAPLDLTAVTADQLAGRIAASAGLSVGATAGILSLTAPNDDTLDPVSYVKASGGPTELVFGADPTKHEVKASEAGDTMAGVAGVEASVSALKKWNYELGKMPEDTRNLTRPLRKAVGRLSGAMNSLRSAVQSAVDIVGYPLKGMPSVPSDSIGLIANGGITLGTKDRIVGAGGKGVVFVCDGGRGKEDHQKFVASVKGVSMEDFVNLAMKWDPIDMALKKALKREDDADEHDDTLGFRVLSDTTVDLLGSRSAQLMALGRAKLTTALPDDGKDDVGVGVVRVAGSYATEVAGYRKVVISARSAGKDEDTGGRVELAGQTIAIGGMNLDDAEDTQDFGGKTVDGWADDHPAFGLEPLDVEQFAGYEHLNDTQKENLDKDFKKLAWTKTLREGKTGTGHPSTQRVLVHAVKETVMQVGPYYVHIRGEDDDVGAAGITIGTRVKSKNPLENDLDTDKPFLFVGEDRIFLGQSETGSMLSLEDGAITISDESNDDGDPQGGFVKIEGGEVTVANKGEAATVTVGNACIEAKKGGASLKITDSALVLKGDLKFG